MERDEELPHVQWAESVLVECFGKVPFYGKQKAARYPERPLVLRGKLWHQFLDGWGGGKRLLPLASWGFPPLRFYEDVEQL